MRNAQYLPPAVVAVAVEATQQAGDQLVAPGNHLGMVHSGTGVGWPVGTGPVRLVPSYHLAGATDPRVDRRGLAGVGVQAFQCESLAGPVAVSVLALA